LSRLSRFRFTAAAVLSEAGRWLLLASLIYAPWAFGTTRDWTIEILEAALFAMGAIWVSGLLLTRIFHPKSKKIAKSYW
jgi:hypothetical protein